MNLRDLRAVGDDEFITCDVCVVGSGPAGATILQELTRAGVDVLLLESGGPSRQALADALSEIEDVGAPRVADQSLMRPRVLGGASSIWSGRCVPLDDIDYERRSWVPHSGWPIGPGDVAPYLDRTVPHLGLGVGRGFNGAGFWRLARRSPPRQALDGEALLPFFWQYSRDELHRFDYMRFGRRLQAARGGETLRVLTNATVVHVNTDAAAAVVRGVEVADPEGRRHTVHARRVVLCAGGIENARLLLASRRVAGAGLGNGRGLVGRYLMDHPRGSVATFDVRDYRALGRHFGFHSVRSALGTHLFCQGLWLSPRVQAREGLLNCTAWMSELVMPDDPWTAVKRVMTGKGVTRADIKAVASNMGLFARGLHRHLIQHRDLPRKVEALKLTCTVEQQPDPESRVMLSDRVDRHGVPISRIDWRINAAEQATVRRMGRLVTEGLAGQGYRRVVLDDWVARDQPFPPEYQDVAHPTGTTRMSASPAEGVVDRDCMVHGVRGLYVGGSSVFPTSGHANPTQMVVALAVRLADRLKQARELSVAA